MIKNWGELSKIQFNNILLGNGFSRTYWNKFEYRSLLEMCGDEPVGRYLCTKEIFKKLNTENFEEVLRAVYHAYIVSIDNQDAIKTLYLGIRKSLIVSVKNVHPKPSDIPNNKIGKCLSDYGSVFTTNYDLLPYWASLDGYSDKFVDYFWGDGIFNLANTVVFPGKVPIHYLHGALHLQSNNISDARKVSIKIESGVEEAINLQFVNSYPLFITEGRSALKISRIRGNSYLNFCYEKLCLSKGGLVVYGHDLNPEYEEHIVEAIRQSQNEEIAIGVFSLLSATKKEVFAAKVSDQLDGLGKKVHFFETETHPLSRCNESQFGQVR